MATKSKKSEKKAEPRKPLLTVKVMRTLERCYEVARAQAAAGWEGLSDMDQMEVNIFLADCKAFMERGK